MDDLFEFGDIERFEEVIVGPQFHRLDGGLGGAVGRHHDDEQFGVGLAEAAEGFEPVDPAHADVHDDQVGFGPGNQTQPLLAAVCGGQLNFRGVENPAERVLHIRLVINQ